MELVLKVFSIVAGIAALWGIGYVINDFVQDLLRDWKGEE